MASADFMFVMSNTCNTTGLVTNNVLYNDIKRWYDLKMSKPGEKGDFCKFYP